MSLMTGIPRVDSLKVTRQEYETVTAGADFTARIPKGTRLMITKVFAPTFLAAAAAAIISAPAASAASTPDCDDDGPAAVCARNGHAAIYAEPNRLGSNLMMPPGGGMFGAGPMPPLLAID